MFTAKAYAYPITTPEGKTLKVHWAVLEAKTEKMQEMAAISARTVAKYTPSVGSEGRRPGGQLLQYRSTRKIFVLKRISGIQEGGFHARRS